jgi:ATP-binding cassette subfamily A (ABC1) protein 3
MKNGAVASVIESLSKTVRDAGKDARLYATSADMIQDCGANTKGTSACYGSILFWSSPLEGSDYSAKGTWNYTLRGDEKASNGRVDVSKSTNPAEVYVLPFQRAVDQEIISRSIQGQGNTSPLPDNVDGIIYTSESQAALLKARDGNYLALCIYLFGAIFSFAMISIVYHMTAFVASERELGMSGLIDTMIPGGSNIRAQLARQISTYISFFIIYLPSWLTVGIVISVVVFPHSSRGIPVWYHVLSGLAFTSFSLLGSSFFRKAQLSGSIMVVIALVTAILPQVLYDQSRTTCLILSLLFPSSNYTYFITGLATFEAGNGLLSDKSMGLLAVKVDLMRATPDTTISNGDGDVAAGAKWRVELYIHIIFLVLQIIVYPVLAFFLEQVLFSKTSSNRTFAPPKNEDQPTVTLTTFCKTYTPSIIGRIFKRSKDVHAVAGIELSAYEGQILCLLGPNGSGKSTTLNCIAGQQKITSGNISIDPSGGIGYAPQANVIWPELTVSEHIKIFSTLKCIDGVNTEIVSELVKMCDLENKLPFKAKTLSGGQKRKLQLAMMYVYPLVHPTRRVC